MIQRIKAISFREAVFAYEAGYFLKETNTKNEFLIDSSHIEPVMKLIQWKREKEAVENEKRKKYHYR
jgi:hypothetical protein